jgi:oxygen-dependent protoporphyrinogen oxidase
LIIIVGAGVSGLAAAFELSGRGIPFRLFESSERVGGLILTECVDGYTIDAGADSMLTTKPAARSLCEDLGLGPRLQTMTEPRTAYVLSRDRLFALPSPSVLGLPLTAGAAARYALLPLAARLRVPLERVIPAAVPEDESIASLFRRRFGAATVDLVAQPLLGGIHAGNVEQLSVRSLFPALAEAERSTGSILRSLSRRPLPPGGLFLSLRGGMETLARTISNVLPAGAVQCGAAVRGLATNGGEWSIDADSGGARATAVVLAAPVHVTARLLESVDTEAANLCSDIRHASTVSVALGWPQPSITNPLRGSGFVVAGGQSRFRVTACSWVSSKWEGRAPEGHVLLRAFVGGVHDPAAIELRDEELVDIATGDLSRLLEISGTPHLARVHRWPDASPQLVVGHEARIARVEERLKPHAGLFVTGRGFRAVGIPDCVADARRAAGAAADYVTSLRRSHRA